MIAAFATWNSRIAPVFDVTRKLNLVDREGVQISKESEVQLHAESPAQIALTLAELQVDVLVCGAISQPLRAMVMAYGIEVIPFVAGELDRVIDAWLQGRLLRSSGFAMPGCGRGYGRHGLEKYNHREEATMFGRGSGKGGGGGQGGGKKGMGGRGRMGGQKAAGPAGECLCPACGHREAHERGVPCAQKLCPKCGAAMTRA